MAAINLEIKIPWLRNRQDCGAKYFVAEGQFADGHAGCIVGPNLRPLFVSSRAEKKKSQARWLG
jgi:hypothetical protein